MTKSIFDIEPSIHYHKGTAATRHSTRTAAKPDDAAFHSSLARSTSPSFHRWRASYFDATLFTYHFFTRTADDFLADMAFSNNTRKAATKIHIILILPRHFKYFLANIYFLYISFIVPLVADSQTAYKRLTI